VGDTDATVEVGALLVGVVALLVPFVVEPLALEPPVELPPEGAGETIDTGEEAEEPLVVEEEVEELLDDVLLLADAGLELSFGTPLANGSRAIRASTTFAGSLDGAGVVEVWLLVVAVAEGGAGGSAVPPADALLSSSVGTAAIPTTSSATTIHSLRSIRSRRSELIPGLRWRCRKRSSPRVADRWTR
jgi:hypothetical protein